MNDTKRLAQDDAALDKDFADAGIFLLDLPHLGRESILNDIKAQYSSTAQRLYFTGKVRAGAAHSVYLLGCLKPDGTLDPDFGENGITSGHFSMQSESGGTSITVLPDGKILLLGRVFGNSVPALARFTSDGTRDLEFGGDDGYVILRMPDAAEDPIQSAASDMNESQDSSTSVIPLDEGKILVTRTYVVSHLADTRAYLFVLNRDGSLDTSFNQKGYVQVIYPGADQTHVVLRGGFLDKDGTIVVVGNLRPAPLSARPLMARYTRDGQPDARFGTGGFFIPTQELPEFGHLNAVIGQPNNRLLGIGATDDGQGLLISLEPDGKYNIQFNGAKPLLTQLGNITYWAAGAMQPDGKIVLCGAIAPADKSMLGVVARLLSDGTLDETFHGRGWVATQVNGRTFFNALTLQNDKKIVAAGVQRTDGNAEGVILRYLS
ncbi:MAG TPA: hypothetical protein VNV36_09350 [Pseudomonas sp.]|uniref:hypothetical protein n=1 Tax=Pseudomonas sp. TaxID=306 RepID=UPI002CAEF960|nr:hypothetical protein [Pseudomonas sp.]HWH86966.1 hypothetical protein [Pseudomonas sp.]